MDRFCRRTGSFSSMASMIESQVTNVSRKACRRRKVKPVKADTKLSRLEKRRLAVEVASSTGLSIESPERFEAIYTTEQVKAHTLRKPAVTSIDLSLAVLENRGSRRGKD